MKIDQTRHTGPVTQIDNGRVGIRWSEPLAHASNSSVLYDDRAFAPYGEGFRIDQGAAVQDDRLSAESSSNGKKRETSKSEAHGISLESLQ